MRPPIPVLPELVPVLVAARATEAGVATGADRTATQALRSRTSVERRMINRMYGYLSCFKDRSE